MPHFVAGKWSLRVCFQLGSWNGGIIPGFLTGPKQSLVALKRGAEEIASHRRRAWKMKRRGLRGCLPACGHKQRSPAAHRTGRSEERTLPLRPCREPGLANTLVPVQGNCFWTCGLQNGGRISVHLNQHVCGDLSQSRRKLAQTLLFASCPVRAGSVPGGLLPPSGGASSGCARTGSAGPAGKRDAVHGGPRCGPTQLSGR